MEAKDFVEAVRWKEHSARPRHIKSSFHLWSCRNPIQNPAPTLREYPKGLGKSLVKIYRELNVSEKPLACLRQKADFSYSSDLKLFQDMPIGDTWPDACLKEVYLYLWNSKSTRVPKEWATTLVSFTRSLREATCQQYGISPKETWKSGIEHFFRGQNLTKSQKNPDFQPRGQNFTKSQKNLDFQPTSKQI